MSSFVKRIVLVGALTVAAGAASAQDMGGPNGTHNLVPEAVTGEQVCAVVYATAAAVRPTSEDLVRHCKTLIASYKVPKRIDFSTTPLPKTGAGKIAKPLLRRMADGD